MSGERLRPEGFPFSEEELQQIKRLRMSEIVVGEHRARYSEWLLRGKLGERFDPSAMLAVFAIPANTNTGYIFETEAFKDPKSLKEIMEYWKDVALLTLPPRVIGVERVNYQGLERIGDRILVDYLNSLIPDVMPPAMVAFSRSDSSNRESAYLFSPTLVPPSAAHRFMVEQARLTSRPN